EADDLDASGEPRPGVVDTQREFAVRGSCGVTGAHVALADDDVLGYLATVVEHVRNDVAWVLDEVFVLDEVIVPAAGCEQQRCEVRRLPRDATARDCAESRRAVRGIFRLLPTAEP